MPWWGAVLLVVLAAGVITTAWALFRLSARLAEMEARRSEPDQSMLLLQREVEAARNEAQKGLAETATTVRVQDGEMLLIDGPFVDAKEHLGGYLLVEADDLDGALEIAARIPAARMGGAIEVRPLVER